jgi:anti-anti-sigma regulatory factor
VPGDHPEKRFQVVGDTLTVRGELGRHDSDDFSKALGELLRRGAPSPRVDLTRVEVITSSCVRPLVDAATEAGQQDRRLTVRVRPSLQLMLDVSGVTVLADVETVT